MDDLPGITPLPECLLDWLRPQIDDKMLSLIACADAGNGEHGHFVALQEIRDTGHIPTPLGWKPREVLALVRWSEPDDPRSQATGTGITGHFIRAFSCAVLLRAAADPESSRYFDSENPTLIQFVDSVLKIGPDATRHALQFMCWRISMMKPEDDERPFFALAILLLSAALYNPKKTPMDLAKLSEWVLSEEQEAKERYSREGRNEPAWMFLLGLTHFTSKHDVWKRVTKHVLLDTNKAYPSNAANKLQLIGEQIVYGK